MNDIAHLADDDGFERINRYSTLEAGTYWRLTAPVTVVQILSPRHKARPFVIEPSDDDDLVLLLLGVDSFDGAAHTVELLPHPKNHSQVNYRVRVEEFLNAFTPAPDGEEVRAREMQSIHGRVLQIQQDLAAAQSNPAVIDEYVRLEMEKRAKSDPSLATSKSTDVIVSGGSITPATFISTRMGVEAATALQSTAKRYHAVAEIQTRWLSEKTELISSTLKELSPYFAEKGSVALAQTRGVQKYADELMSSLRSLDIYIGKGVEVENITEGASAPPDQKLCIMQRKLFVDEELSVWASVGALFDFDSLEVFDDALRQHTELRDQIFPFERCVVSMAVRRKYVEYGDGVDLMSQHEMNLRNRRVFLLVRDGERIMRVFSNEPTHDVAKRMFPTHDELGSIFKGYDGEKIAFSDLRFTRQAEEFDRVALSYKRLLILLCGLDHREQLFGEFYPSNEAFSFISLGFQERYMRFVADDDEGLLLTGAAPLANVHDWWKNKNAFLQSGSRVLVRWSAAINSETCPSLVRSGNRLAKSAGSWGQRIAYRDDGNICVDVPAYRGYLEENTYNAKLLLNRAGQWASGFICLDAVQADELRPYIFSRRDRVDHVGYIRLFKHALAYLEAEEAAQRSTLEYLIKAATDAQIFAENEPLAIEAAVREAIRTWRAAKRGAPLPEVRELNDLSPILDLVYRNATSQSLLRRTLEHAASNELKVLRIALSGKNKIALYCEPTELQRDAVTEEFPWVRKYSLSILKTKLSVTSEKWVWLRAKLEDASEKILFESDSIATWEHDYDEPCKPEKITAALETVAKTAREFLMMTSWSIRAGRWDDRVFARLYDDMYEQTGIGQAKMVNDAYWAIPLGTYWDRKGLHVITALLDAEAWLYRLSDEKQRKTLIDKYVGRFVNKPVGLKRLQGGDAFSLVILQFDSLDSSYFFPRWDKKWASSHDPSRALAQLYSVQYQDGWTKWPFADNGKTPNMVQVNFTLAPDALMEAFLRDPISSRGRLCSEVMTGNTGCVNALFNTPFEAAIAARPL